MAETLNARETGNAVVDAEENKADENGVRKPKNPFETFRNVFGAKFTPPVEQPKVAALEPSPKLNPSLLPAMPERPGLGGLDAYIATQGQFGRDEATLFFPQPPTNVEIPRAVDSQNLTAVPPRFTNEPVYQIFSKPRSGTPGYNPSGVNTTKTA